MRKIGITSDNSSGLEYAPFEHNIKITRSSIHFGEETYVDGVDITAEEFYDKIQQTDIVPSTSAPSLGQMVAKLEEWRSEGCTDVIHFPISFNLSEYGKNLEAGMEEFTNGMGFHVCDTNSACLMQGYIAHYAELRAEQGAAVEEIMNECVKLRTRTAAFFVVDDLKYLVKNGRLSAAAGFIGGLAKIKPVLLLGQNGKIEPFEKVRTHRKAVERCIDLIVTEGAKYESVIYVALHTARPDDCQEIANILRERCKNAKRVETSTVTPTVGAHIGAGIIGIGFIPVDGLKVDL